MIKKAFSLLLVLALFAFSAFSASADNGFGDNNTTVEDHLDEDVDFLESTVYEISGDFVLNVAPNTKASDFIQRFTNPQNVSVPGTQATDIIKTNMIVEYSGETTDSCTIVVSGDVDCNGLVNVTDIVNATKEVLYNGTLVPGTAKFKAADIDKSCSVTVVDITKIRDIIIK